VTVWVLSCGEISIWMGPSEIIQLYMNHLSNWC
jgi:hypothetical protein